jgi:hypothetical protein
VSGRLKDGGAQAVTGLRLIHTTGREKMEAPLRKSEGVLSGTTLGVASSGQRSDTGFDQIGLKRRAAPAVKSVEGMGWTSSSKGWGLIHLCLAQRDSPSVMNVKQQTL